MASRRLQDSNRDNAGDFIGENVVTQSCEPCMKTNISKTATVFCKDCDEYLCDTCKNPHTVYKTGKHDIINFEDNKSSTVMIDMKGIDKCHEHGREIEFFCEDHSKLCCSSCVLIHRKCDQVDEIAKVSRQTRPELQELKQSLLQLQSEAEAIQADCEQSETGLNESIEKISSEVDTMRDRFIQLYEDAKQKFITEANELKTAETKRIRNTLDASSKVKDEISKILSMCCIVLERGTPSQQYIYSELIKERRTTMDPNAYDQRKIKVASTVTVSFSKELTSFLEVERLFVLLNNDGTKTGFRAKSRPDASKVRVHGPGVENGILATYESKFIVETKGAGVGQLTVRIRGPKGAFQVEMYRDSQRNRTIVCRFDPTQCGLYIIQVRWSNVDVPGSPFNVNILETTEELEETTEE